MLWTPIGNAISTPYQPLTTNINTNALAHSHFLLLQKKILRLKYIDARVALGTAFLSRAHLWCFKSRPPFFKSLSIPAVSKHSLRTLCICKTYLRLPPSGSHRSRACPDLQGVQNVRIKVDVQTLSHFLWAAGEKVCSIVSTASGYNIHQE